MVVAPDLPVGRRAKPIAQVAINDGLHVHGVLLVPPRPRLRLPVDEHFRTQQSLYARDGGRLDVVDARPIERSVTEAVAYALKSVRRGRFGLDDVLVLPRALSEIERRA